MKFSRIFLEILGCFISLLGVGLLGCAHGKSELLAESKTPFKDVGHAAVLGEGDVVEVRVFEEPELCGVHQVSSEGSIRLPLIGSLKVAGLPPEGAAVKIANEYQKKYIKQPEVSVFVQQFNSRKVFVIGQVKNPGPYSYEEKMTVIAAIARAGGTTLIAAPNRTVVSREREGKQEKMIAKVADMGRGEASALELLPGDIVFVPESMF